MEGTPMTSDDPLIVTCTKCSGKVKAFLLCDCKWTDGPTIRDATAAHFIGQLREDTLRGLKAKPLRDKGAADEASFALRGMPLPVFFLLTGAAPDGPSPLPWHSPVNQPPGALRYTPVGLNGKAFTERVSDCMGWTYTVYLNQRQLVCLLRLQHAPKHFKGAGFEASVINNSTGVIVGLSALVFPAKLMLKWSRRTNKTTMKMVSGIWRWDPCLPLAFPPRVQAWMVKEGPDARPVGWPLIFCMPHRMPPSPGQVMFMEKLDEGQRGEDEEEVGQDKHAALKLALAAQCSY
jgi:hypothetical protein